MYLVTSHHFQKGKHQQKELTNQVLFYLLTDL